MCALLYTVQGWQLIVIFDSGCVDNRYQQHWECSMTHLYVARVAFPAVRSAGELLSIATLLGMSSSVRATVDCKTGTGMPN